MNKISDLKKTCRVTTFRTKETDKEKLCYSLSHFLFHSASQILLKTESDTWKHLFQKSKMLERDILETAQNMDNLFSKNIVLIAVNVFFFKQTDCFFLAFVSMLSAAFVLIFSLKTQQGFNSLSKNELNKLSTVPNDGNKNKQQKTI